MIGVLDYGMGNLGSVLNTCRKLEIPAKLISSPEGMEDLHGILMPGQGAFRDCMSHLRDHGFVDPLCAWVAENRPFFGICMGLQVLFEDSEESPGVDGLGILPGTVRRFKPSDTLKVPQMGWNRVRWTQKQSFFPEALHDRHFYFVHSYYVPITNVEGTDVDWAGGITSYGIDYVSAISFGECHAVQFHPEKSQRDGLALIRAFADRVNHLQNPQPENPS
ncbi:MAG: imidazole glycerol phosphate synthase subunit HisH [Verrucomicrobia bacterium]|nr:imidazole glycerol phosphate synthase subunit HisH [Verrucomicrobiota bacterium]MCH8513953.1 imidazole glycerol phosphate synthase subunit HisH [Kiritimatiellia bacterium]